MTSCSVGLSRSTPWMVTSEVPSPSILAPMDFNISHRSTISGSRAALWRTVVPSAKTAAVKMFSVAPTEGKSKRMVEPRSSEASATTAPCSMRVVAPSFSKPVWCISSGREPMASPPGSATLACPQREVSGPRTHTDALNWRTASKSAFDCGFAGVVMRTVLPSIVTSQPKPSSTFFIKGTSRISGQLVSVVVPSASNAAAMSLRTLFFAPSTLTVPARRAPPETIN